MDGNLENIKKLFVSHAFSERRDCQVLWEHILTERLKKPSCSAIERHKNGFPKKVFQILTNGPESSILFSWPPPRLFESMQDEFSKSNTETYRDGSYFADVFASLTYRLHFEEKYSGKFEILTACKKNLQTAMALNIDGFAIDLQIMMIPHGEIKFVIVSISKAEYLAAQEPKRSEIYNLPSAMEQRYPYPLYENFGTTLPEQERKHPDYASNTHPSQICRHIDPLGDSPWVQAPQDFTHFPVSWMSDSAMSGNRQENYLVEGNEEQAFPPMMNGALSQAQPAGLPNQPDQSIYGSLSGPQNESSSSLLSYSHHGQSVFPPAIMESSEKVCTACGSKNSPEWRPGPEGVKSLCNACGLRFSRANAKVQKREKDARTASEMIAGGVLTPAHTGEEVDNKCDFKRGRSANFELV